MPIPSISITAQTRRANIITVYGKITGLGTGTATISLPADSVPNGAVSKPAVAVVINPTGYFEHAFTAVAYGNYAPAIVTATNVDGTTTATSMAMRLYALGTMPSGTPAILFPNKTVPSFSAVAVAVGAEVTTVTLESTSSSAQTNVPFTFGQPFKQGDLSPQDFLVGKIIGAADVPLQLNVKATHPDGSVRHAIVSGVLPTLAAGATKTISMVRATTGTSTTAFASNVITAAGFTSLVNLTIDGVVYTADATSALSAGMDASGAWISGSIATEYSVNIPLKAADGAEHADLTAQFNVRYYQGANVAKVDITVEHTKAYTAINDISYTGEVRVGGASVMTLQGDTAGSSVVHLPTGGWKRTFWWNNSSPVHVKHNVPYLIGSKQVPNYDQSVVFKEATFVDYATRMAGPNFGLFKSGEFAAYFPATGGRPELGLMPTWYATALLSQDKRAKAMMLALADCARGIPVHRRDTTAGGLGAGKPINLVYYPYAGSIGTYADAQNTATGKTERLPDIVSSSPFTPDSSHQSAFAYLPYLVTGDLFYLEELHFWCNFNLTNKNPAYRFYEKGLLYRDQVRGQAWSMRTLGHAAAITPDAHPTKQPYEFWLTTNLSFYNNTFTDNVNANGIHIVDVGTAIVYLNTDNPPRGIGNFQDDFWTQSVGNVAELGFPEAKRLLLWKAKYQVSRLIGQGICWMDACNYAPYVRSGDATTPVFSTIAEVNAASIPAAVLSLPCNSPERVAKALELKITTASKVGELGNYASTTQGFASNFQPALAYAVDSGYPNADLAWGIFSSRTVKPDYGDGPQFAVIPRTFQAEGAQLPAQDSRYARPSEDITQGTWQASAGTSLFSMIMEQGAADSTNYIKAATPGTAECKLASVVTPNPSNGQAVRYQVWDAQGGTVKVQLKQGSAVIAEWIHANLPTVPTVYEQYLTQTQSNSITNYTDLRCAFIAG